MKNFKFKKTDFNVWNNWFTNANSNYQSSIFNNHWNAYRKQYYSISDFRISLIYIALPIILIYGPYLIYAIGITYLTLTPNFSNNATLLSSWKTWFTLVRVYIPFFVSFLFIIFYSFYFAKIFWQSGAFVLFFYEFLVNFPRLLRNFFNLNYGQFGQWIYLLSLLLIFILAIWLIPDLRRSFFLLFFEYETINLRYHIRQLKKSKQPYDPIVSSSDGVVNVSVPVAQKLRLNFSSKIFLVFLGTFAVFYLLSISSNYFAFLLTRLFPTVSNSNQSSIDTQLRNPNFWLVVLPLYLLILFGAPLVEELVYRLSFSSFGAKKWFSIVASGLVFGLIHTQNDGLFNILGYAFFGWTMAFAYNYTGNYWIVFLIHFTNNAFSLIF